MKYRVTVNYIDITFDDRNEALDFADMAKAHSDKGVSVTITLIGEEEEA